MGRGAVGKAGNPAGLPARPRGRGGGLAGSGLFEPMQFTVECRHVSAIEGFAIRAGMQFDNRRAKRDSGVKLRNVGFDKQRDADVLFTERADIGGQVIVAADGVQPESLLDWLLDPSTKCIIGTWESVNVREITSEDQRRFLIQSHGLKSASLTY